VNVSGQPFSHSGEDVGVAINSLDITESDQVHSFQVSQGCAAKQNPEGRSDIDSTGTLVDRLLERIGSMHIVPGGHIRYHGPTSNFNLVKMPILDMFKASGSIFVDCSIHDIDLMLWFVAENYRIKSFQAVDVAAVHPGIEANKDMDNTIAITELYDGRIAALYCSRMMAAGQEDSTEIICQRGSLRANMQGRKNHVETHDSLGARRELPQHSFERFRDAFVTEANEFISCCLDNTALPVSLNSSVRALATGQALHQSLVSGDKMMFDEINAKL
jgi:myo-inositol 2-dehydrogenase/D-chiro-inositol 1-dehydrogenase